MSKSFPKAQAKSRRESAARSAPVREPSSERWRVMVVEDYPVTRMGLVGLINAQPDMKVCCEAEDPATARRHLMECRVDLVVADLSMPGTNGVRLIDDLRALKPAVKILVLSMHEESVYGRRAIQAGAQGYVMKSAGGLEVLAAMRQVLDGGLHVSAGLSQQFLADLSGATKPDSVSPVDRLTNREFELFQLVGRGKEPNEMARELNLSVKTIDVHRANIRRKLRLPSSTSLVHFAVRWMAADGANRSRPV